MRVIGGSFRSRRLQAPAGAATRPTSDRLRETLFNVLAPRIQGASLMDLYSGTGAVGIEALSRGAGHVLFAENAPSALRVLRANLIALGIDTGVTIDERAAIAVIRGLLGGKAPARRFDLVFLDPPYENEREYATVLDLLGSAEAAAILADGALVIAEHATRRPLGEGYGRLRRTRTLRQGDATLTFFACGDDPVAEEAQRET